MNGRWAAAVCAALAALAGQILLLHGLVWPSVAAYAAAIILMFFLPPAPAGPPATEGPSARRLAAAGIGIVTLIAAFTRIYRLESVPPGLWLDETDLARAALEILEGARPLPWLTGPLAEISNTYPYIQAATFAVFGVSLGTLKSTGVLGGILTTPVLFLLARKFLRTGTSLLVAALWSVCFWAVNIGRWGHVNSWSGFFGCMVLLLLWNGLEDGRRAAFAGAGAILGFSLLFYASNRAFAAIAAVFWLHRLLASAPARKRTLLGVPLFILGALPFVAPLAVGYARDYKYYLQRSYAISVFNPENTREPWALLWKNALAYLGCLNVRGDYAPRHNIRVDPMLDVALAPLFPLGVVQAFRSLGRPGPFLVVAWLAVFFAGGSLTSQAPNVFRVFGAVPAVLLAVGLAADALWGAVSERLRWNRGFAGFAVACLFCGFVAKVDLRTYFVDWADLRQTWDEFRADQTKVAFTLARLKGPWTVYLDRIFYGYSNIDIFSPRLRKEHQLVTDQLLAPASAKGPFMWMMGPYASRFAPFLMRTYPKAVLHRELFPQGDIAYASVTLRDIPPDGLLSARYAGTEPAGPLLGEAETAGPPGPETSGGALPRFVRWRGALRVAVPGAYRFEIKTPNESRLFVNGHLVLAAGPGAGAADTWLPAGAIPVRLDRIVRGDDALTLAWKRPAASALEPIPPAVLAAVPMPEGGLVSVHWDGCRMTGPPVTVRHDPLLAAVSYGTMSTAGQRWLGTLVAPETGRYEIVFRSDDGGRLFLDGKLVIADWTMASSGYINTATELTAGPHPLRIDYLDHGGSYWFEIRWKPPGAAASVAVPPEAMQWSPEDVREALTPPPALPVGIDAYDVTGRKVGLLEPAETKTGAAKSYPAQRNASFQGWVMNVRDSIFDEGIGVYGPTELAFEVARGYTRLEGRAGVDHDTSGDHHLTFRIVADGRTVFTNEVIDLGAAAVRFDIPLAGVKRVSLVVEDDPDGRADGGDWVNLKLTR